VFHEAIPHDDAQRIWNPCREFQSIEHPCGCAPEVCVWVRRIELNSLPAVNTTLGVGCWLQAGSAARAHERMCHDENLKTDRETRDGSIPTAKDVGHSRERSSRVCGTA
jgi:hypothetical protein